jgi:ribulose bisphosphate carboxylase small subunit
MGALFVNALSGRKVVQGICRQDGLITEGLYRVNPTDRYVRIECVDEKGKKAVSQLIKV